MVLKNANLKYEIVELPGRPILKWAGGKSQLLTELLPKIPKNMASLLNPSLVAVLYFFQPDRNRL